MARFAFHQLRATVVLLALAFAIAIAGVPAQSANATSSGHVLTLSPQASGAFQSDAHNNPFYDVTGSNSASLTYTDEVRDMWDGDGNPVADPHQMYDQAIWGRSCVYKAGVPSADWRGGSGLVTNTPDDALSRLDTTTWDVLNQARRWYTYPDYQNYGLVFSGFDEGTGFINNSWCSSQLSNFQLRVDFEANDPAPPPVLLGDGSQFVRIAPPPARLALALQPGPPPALPDLTVAKVEVKGNTATQANTCLAGDNTVTVTVGNIGYVPVGQFEADLWVDGGPGRNKTRVGLANGQELAVVFNKIRLNKGTHLIQVYLDPENKISELDKTNNTYSENRVCK